LFSLGNRHRNLLSEGAASYCHPINFSLTNGEIFVTLTKIGFIAKESLKIGLFGWLKKCNSGHASNF